VKDEITLKHKPSKVKYYWIYDYECKNQKEK
jgi:hypothetical protein